MAVAKKPQQYIHRSPLRYPGGKTRAIKIITKYFPKDLKELCSPFFGGGSIELHMAAQGVKVYGSDAFKPLVAFWQVALHTPKQLAEHVQKYYPLSKKKFYELQKTYHNYPSKLERAAILYVLNRSSFSGTTLSGGMSPHHPRFTKSSIERLQTFRNKNVSVQHMDFKIALKKYPNLFLYLDPPYATKQTLYGRKGDTHRQFDHEGLCEILKQRKNWILSYNDCAYIRKLYRGFRIKKLQWKYGMPNKKGSNEILIFSNDFRIHDD